MGSVSRDSVENSEMMVFSKGAIILIGVLEMLYLFGAQATFNDATSYCTIDWSVRASCGIVVPAISQSMQDWIEIDSCGSSPRGEECQYVSQDFDQIYSVRAIHIILDGFESNFQFLMTVEGDSVCQIRARGFTTKEEVTDPDFNYCTLQWIMQHSNLATLY